MEGNDDLLDYSQKNFLPSWEDKSIVRLAVREVENLISHTFDGLFELKLQLYGSAMSGLNLKGAGDADLDFSLSFPSGLFTPQSVFKKIKDALYAKKTAYKTKAASFSCVTIIKASFG